MATRTYKKGSAEKLSANFRVSEFACKGVGCCSTSKVDEQLVAYLQQIREHFGKPVTVSSAYRCATHNKSVGGAAGSYHLYGQAADIIVKDTSPADVAKYAESIGVKGIGLYETFVHIDTRDNKSFWYGHAQAYRSTFGGAVESALSLPNLSKGSRGETVRAAQLLLIGRGFGCGSSGADGAFGGNTECAVKGFQKKQGLTQSGTVDAKTWAALLGV